MSKGMILKSRATGLRFTVIETNGDTVRVRDDEGRVLNHWFPEEFFLRA